MAAPVDMLVAGIVAVPADIAEPVVDTAAVPWDKRGSGTVPAAGIAELVDTVAVPAGIAELVAGIAEY